MLPGGIPNIEYESNSEFNEELDRQYPLDGKLLYSAALYRLYYEDYVIELEAFTDAQREAENGEGGEDGDAN